MIINFGFFIFVSLFASFVRAFDPGLCVDGSYDQVVVTAEEFRTHQGTWTGTRPELQSAENELYVCDLPGKPQTQTNYTNISTEAEYATVEFFFHALGQWLEADYINIYVGPRIMKMDNFDINEGDDSAVYESNTVKIVSLEREWGITLLREFVGSASEMERIEDQDESERLDQVYKLTLTVPSAYFCDDGILTIGFEFCMAGEMSEASGASGRYDKLNITEHFDCGIEAPTPAPTPVPITDVPTPAINAVPNLFDPSKCMDGSYDQVVITEESRTHHGTWTRTESELCVCGQGIPQTKTDYTNISTEAEYALVEFFFHAIGQWAEADYINIYLGSIIMKVDNFGISKDDHSAPYEVKVIRSVQRQRKMQSWGDVTLLREFETERVEEIYKFTLTVPSPYFDNGILTIGFEFCMAGETSGASGRYDKLNITEHFDCGAEAPTGRPFPTLAGGQCDPLLSFEDFGDSGNCDASNWINGITETYGTNTDIGCFLGRYGGMMGDFFYTGSPWRIFHVPTDSPFITISFKFLEIDQWENQHDVSIEIGGQQVDMGKFNKKDESQNDYFQYTEPNTGMHLARKSVSETYNMAFSEHAEKIHDVKVSIPNSVYVDDGELMVKFVFAFNEYVEDESFGIDDFSITRSCGTFYPTNLPTDSPTNQPSSAPGDAGVGGDPHFKTWAGERYDFHGLCDLVLLENHSFKNNRGMDIHVRTKKIRSWSYVSNAALRIGEDIFELIGSQNGSHYWINGVVGKKIDKDNFLLPFSFSGYFITFRLGLRGQHGYYIDLGNQGMIVMKTWNDLVRVDILGGKVEDFGDSRGLMGRFPTGEKMARDNVSELKDIDAFGQEWQVRINEVKLFHNSEGSQHPQLCKLPTTVDTRRRLQESFVSQHEAEIACSRVSKSDRGLCTFDVMATNDVDVALAYSTVNVRYT